MAQQHLDRLTAVDAGFLAHESPNAHMHVGALLIFEGPPPRLEAFAEHVRSRLHLVPRFRQKLAVPPLDAGRPLWIDDPHFNLDFHLRHSALPAPGSADQLRELAARIFSQALDHSRPLWELYLVEGLEHRRFAVISKTHHALVDGVSGVDLATVLFDPTPVPRTPAHPAEAWVPRPEPSPADLLAAGVTGLVRTSFGLAGRALSMLERPERTLGGAVDALEGIGEVVWAGLNPAPATPFNVPLGPHRRFVTVQARLSEYKEIKNAFGGTVNDVMLAVVAGALRVFLHHRGVRTDGLELRGLVPVSIRSDDQRHQLGNRLAVMRGPLPVYVEDPIARLRIVREAMAGVKESRQALGAEMITTMQNFAPPTLLAQASRLNFSTRLFNLLVTNVPGPQFPLYLLGREMIELYPIAFLPDRQALAVAIMSYNGEINFGLLGDYDALHDIDVVQRGIEDSLAELLQAARRVAAASAPEPAGEPVPAP